MTKKDYELIIYMIDLASENLRAEQFILDASEPEVNYSIRETFCNVLENKNPRFNKEKFLKACGVQTLCKKCNTDLDSATHRWGHCDNYCLNKEHYKQVLLNGFCLKCGKRE